jgi:hypothetical protein
MPASPYKELRVKFEGSDAVRIECVILERGSVMENANLTHPLPELTYSVNVKLK